MIEHAVSRAIRCLALATLLAACGAPASSPPPTPSPIPEPSPTPEASPTPLLSPTPPPYTLATPPIILEPPDSAPSPTPEPPKVGLPTESLSILEPGPGSQVVSPMRVVGYGGPSFQGRVRLRLLGEDGTILAQRVTYLQALPGLAGRFFTQVPFSITHVGEAARLEISTYELRSGLLGHLASIDLVLLSVGLPRVNPAVRGAEKLAIFAPREGARVQGGTVTVRGAGWLDTSGPLVVDVLDRNGVVIGSTTTTLVPPGIGQVGKFDVNVTYRTDVNQWGRIAVHEPAVGIPGTLHYNSLEVYLEP